MADWERQSAVKRSYALLSSDGDQDDGSFVLMQRYQEMVQPDRIEAFHQALTIAQYLQMKCLYNIKALHDNN